MNQYKAKLPGLNTLSNLQSETQLIDDSLFDSEEEEMSVPNKPGKDQNYSHYQNHLKSKDDYKHHGYHTLSQEQLPTYGTLNTGNQLIQVNGQLVIQTSNNQNIIVLQNGKLPQTVQDIYQYPKQQKQMNQVFQKGSVQKSSVQTDDSDWDSSEQLQQHIIAQHKVIKYGFDPAKYFGGIQIDKLSKKNNDPRLKGKFELLDMFLGMDHNDSGSFHSSKVSLAQQDSETESDTYFQQEKAFDMHQVIDSPKQVFRDISNKILKNSPKTGLLNQLKKSQTYKTHPEFGKKKSIKKTMFSPQFTLKNHANQKSVYNIISHLYDLKSKSQKQLIEKKNTESTSSFRSYDKKPCGIGPKKPTFLKQLPLNLNMHQKTLSTQSQKGKISVAMNYKKNATLLESMRQEMKYACTAEPSLERIGDITNESRSKSIKAIKMNDIDMTFKRILNKQRDKKSELTNKTYQRNYEITKAVSASPKFVQKTKKKLTTKKKLENSESQKIKIDQIFNINKLNSGRKKIGTRISPTAKTGNKTKGSMKDIIPKLTKNVFGLNDQLSLKKMQSQTILQQSVSMLTNQKHSSRQIKNSQR